MEEVRSDGGIHSAANAEDNLFLADAVADFADCQGPKRLHVPISPAAAHAEQEVAENLISVNRVEDFRVELEAEMRGALIAHDGDLGIARPAENLVSRREGDDLIAVAHPDGLGFVQSFKQRAFFFER